MGDVRISELLKDAGKGDTILFYPGTYHGPYVLEEVHGAIDQPVVIMGLNTGLDQQSIIDGESEPGIALEKFAFLLRSCSWISIENFSIKNCWTDLIYAENVSYLSLKKCNMTGGRRALFATGRESHHFLVENCRWEQDERVWTHAGDYTWDELHHGIHHYYNGSIFQGSGISGVFVIRDNHIQNTFNAFRLSPVNEGVMDRLACSNGEIYRNTIINTSDNVLEPEVSVFNLHYYHNHMINGHAFISITEVTGGPVYIYGNTAVSLPESGDGWTVFKISNRRNGLTAPLNIFNNSWQVDFNVVGSSDHIWSNDHVNYFNNASVMEVHDTFGIYNLGEENNFDYNCSNLPFPALLTGNGFEKHGIVADPLFSHAYGNDFRLKANSPCIDKGRVADNLILSYAGEAPDIGAYDNGRLVEGIPFRFMNPPAEVSFKENPRITRHRVHSNGITLWFSVPLDPQSAGSVNFSLKQGDETIDLEIAKGSDDPYRLELSAGKKLPGGEARLNLDRRPLGINKMPLTGWASTIPVTFY